MVVNACYLNITEYFLKRSNSKEEAMCFISKVRGFLQFMIIAYFFHMQKKNNIAVLLYLEFGEVKTLTLLTWFCLYYSDDKNKNEQ